MRCQKVGDGAGTGTRTGTRTGNGGIIVEIYSYVITPGIGELNDKISTEIDAIFAPAAA